MSALRQLIQNSIDYAGLFPPAALPLEEVVDNYAAYLESEDQDYLARIILPAGKLEPFQQLRAHHSSDKIWPISCLVPPIQWNSGNQDSAAFDSAWELIQTFNQSQTAAIVDAVEIRLQHVDCVEPTIAAVPAGIAAFLEVPWNEDPTPLITSIATHKSGRSVYAKIRTGGVTPDLIPSPETVANFIATSARHNLGFKATAGLHHPIRGTFPLTYEPDSDSAEMHGYLNVFLASAFAFAGNADQKSITAILQNTNPQRFVFEADQIRFDEISISVAAIEQARSSGIFSFGSCSFVEPTEEVRALPGAPLN